MRRFWWLPLMVILAVQGGFGVYTVATRGKVDRAAYTTCVNQNNIAHALKGIVADSQSGGGVSRIPPELVARINDPAVQEILALFAASGGTTSKKVRERAKAIIIRDCAPLHP